MKKILLTSIALVGCCVGAFGQGQIEFLNDDSSGNGITLVTPGGANSGSGLVVSLLWYNGSSFITESTFTSTFTGGGNAANSPGYFTGSPLDITIPVAGTETFEVTASYTGAGNTVYSGTTASFTAITRASPTPATSDDAPGDSGWDGTLVLTSVPEPTTIALGGLGAAALLLFRRRK